MLGAVCTHRETRSLPPKAYSRNRQHRQSIGGEVTCPRGSDSSVTELVLEPRSRGLPGHCSVPRPRCLPCHLRQYFCYITGEQTWLSEWCVHFHSIAAGDDSSPTHPAAVHSLRLWVAAGNFSVPPATCGAFMAVPSSGHGSAAEGTFLPAAVFTTACDAGVVSPARHLPSPCHQRIS